MTRDLPSFESHAGGINVGVALVRTPLAPISRDTLGRSAHFYQIVIVELANAFELVAEKGPEVGRKLPFAVQVCTNPFCSCRRLTIILEERAAMPGTGIESAPRCEFEIDLETGDAASDHGSSTAASQRVDDFLKCAIDADFQELLDVFNRRKQHVIYDAPLGDVPKDWRKGVDVTFLVGFHEIFPLANTLQVEHDGIQYWVEDCYCLREGCDCGETMLHFAPAPKTAKVSKAISECQARYNCADSTFHSEHPGTSGKIQVLMAQLFAQCPGVRNLLRKRYDRVRQLVVEKPPASPKPAINTQKAGRNDPCPCGSGIKYKKCCGG